MGCGTRLCPKNMRSMGTFLVLWGVSSASLRELDEVMQSFFSGVEHFLLCTPLSSTEEINLLYKFTIMLLSRVTQRHCGITRKFSRECDDNYTFEWDLCRKKRSKTVLSWLFIVDIKFSI